MSTMIQRFGAILALTVASSGVLAVELAGQPRFATESWGVESDRNSGPAYTQSFVAPVPSVLESITWWGFHGDGSAGTAADHFVVTLDGVEQTGTLSVTQMPGSIFEYTLDVPDAALTAGTLGIVNDSDDVIWFWQSAPAVGNPDAPSADLVSFSLVGHLGTPTPDGVPEPAPVLLALLPLAALALGRRRRPGLHR
ncbi:MAG: hypothetical protein U1F56_10820 [Rubrivivax sp.]